MSASSKCNYAGYQCFDFVLVERHNTFMYFDYNHNMQYYVNNSSNNITNQKIIINKYHHL